MKFNYIEMDTWKRKPYFEHYVKEIPCTYSMTIKLDITKIIKNNKKIYLTLLYLLTKGVNKFVEFRTAFDGEGKLGYFENMHPCYTIFHKEEETFTNLWTEFDENYEKFCQNYENDLKNYGSSLEFSSKPKLPVNTFPVSMIPWESFEGFNLNLQKGYNYLLPIFTFGKYYKEGEKYLIPMAIQVHHGVCDGFHLCRFIESIRQTIETEI